MKLKELLSEQVLQQSKLWHITEKSNLEKIKQVGMLAPKSQMRGARYDDHRLHFFTSLDEEVIEEIEGVVRFGGMDFDNEDLILKQQEIPLVILELDLQTLREFDESMNWNRQWYPDEGVTDGVGVWTKFPIPVDALHVIKTL